MVASGCAAARRWMIGRIRSRFGPTRRRASETKLRATQVWTGADEVERRAGRARVLTRRRPELPRLDRRDRAGQLLLQDRRLIGLVRRRYELVGTLEELVDDLDLVRSRAQGGERVDEPLQTIFALHNLAGRRVLEDVRLVVDDERLAVGL